MIIFRQKNFGFMGLGFTQTVNNFNKMKNATGFIDKAKYAGKTLAHGTAGVAKIGVPLAAAGAVAAGTAIDNVGNN